MSCPVTGLGLNEPTSLALIPKPEAISEQAILFAGFWFADIDGAFKAARSGPGFRSEKVPILELSGQCAGPRSRSWPVLPCTSSDRRRRRD